ncbi:nucleoside-diphosphate sugar epimerase/dehydratase [Salimicrobium sp. PL1-032A]|uniref:polysaccharide biosynthesis protein n=1 Tax=Salimicrobium sp. PL1-032A TaxID=3095364 RepID=UPI00326110E2
MKKKRYLLLVTVDSLLIITSVFLSFFLLVSIRGSITGILATALFLLMFYHVFSVLFGLHKKRWRYASIEELIGVLYAVTLAHLASLVLQISYPALMYGKVLVVTLLFNIVAIAGVRLAWRYYKHYGWTAFPGVSQKRKMNVSNGKRTLIVGAGEAGRMLAKQIRNSPHIQTVVTGFVDDDKTTHHLLISGYPVLGDIGSMERIIKEQDVNHIVIALPSVDKRRLRDIITRAKELVHNVQTLPMIEDIALGKVSVHQVRDVRIEDLLGRESVELDLDAIEAEIKGRTVLVTGAGGSIGSEICRQLLRFSPERLVLLGHGENSIYTIHMELSRLATKTELIPVIADVQDRARIRQVMEAYAPSHVYHAAAHKHVPLMECNPSEAIKNNVIGTRNVAEAADLSGVATFVLVSTDKAVNPPNVMGATKRLAEMTVQMMSRQSATKFTAVRFGNVLGSRGSVVPLFKQQIERGGPVTVTHPDMTRYFMTIPEASRLVLQSGALAKGGEIFVLDMGEPVKITDLARNLIHLSGFTEEEIPIEFSGIRPGEKLYEELLSAEEVYREPVFPNILIGKTVPFNHEAIDDFLDRFHALSADEMKQYAISLANSRAPITQVAK